MALPRLYSLGAYDARLLPQAEQDAIFAEYRAFWRGHEQGNTHNPWSLAREIERDYADASRDQDWWIDGDDESP